MPNLAFAQTSVSKTLNCNYTIEVKLIFNFSDELSMADADQLLLAWTQAIKNIWQTQKLASGCQISYLFKLRQLNAGQSCADYPDYHCIEVVSDQYNAAGNIASTWKTLPDSNSHGWGQWSRQITGLEAAHEVGHLMGLPDDYHYEEVNGQLNWVNENYQLIGPQSIMAQTWGNVQALPEHGQAIITLAGFILPQVTSFWLMGDLKMPRLTRYYLVGDLKVYTERPAETVLVNSLIKGVTDPKVYFVDNQGNLRWVKNELVAQKLFGSDWNQKITNFSDAIIYTYSFGQDLE